MLGYLIQLRQPPEKGYGVKRFYIFFFLYSFTFHSSSKRTWFRYSISFITGWLWNTIFSWCKLENLGIYNHCFRYYISFYLYLWNKRLSKEKNTWFYSCWKAKLSCSTINYCYWFRGFSGKESDEATQTQLKFLPISTSDFIFAYLVERYGFLGAIGLIVLYTLLILHLLSINYFFKDDYVVKVFASGLALLIFLNMSVNILMVIGFAPVVGIPLPLFSYGGSSFINFIITFAILENLIAFRYLDMYSSYDR